MPSGNSFIAIDLGAESGRIVLGTLKGQQLSLNEIHRFPTRGFDDNGRFRWNLPAYWEEIKTGLKEVSLDTNLNFQGIGVDSWGVNLVYLDEDGELVCLPFHYRDDLIHIGDTSMRKSLDMDRVYEITGIQEVKFNGLVHLFGIKEMYPEILQRTRSIVMIPDYFNYLLTRKLFTEYTNSTTTQFFDAHKKCFSSEILLPIGLTPHVFPSTNNPGKMISILDKSVQKEVGLGPVPVWSIASHDTASAVVAVPAEGENWAFLSSGTWSLIGVEIDSPIINEKSRRFNLTNEGGAFGKIRLLKNVMGLWIIQRCRDIWMQETGFSLSYGELSEEAEYQGVNYIIDVDAPEFFNPPNMLEAIDEHCRENGHDIPENRGQYIHLVYNSLATRYRAVIEELETTTGTHIDRLYIVGGGSQDAVLNGMIASKLRGIEVYAGPTEATAIGNIMMQAFAKGLISGQWEIRQIVRNSFDIHRC
jgi:rhamnulokinase